METSRLHTGNEEERSMKDPAAFHSLILDNGQSLQIEFYYDTNMITLENFSPVARLDDLCFFFTRATSHAEYDPERQTYIEIIMFGDRKIRLEDDDKEGTRLRIGSWLALGNLGVLFQGSQKLDQTPHYTVKIRLTNSIDEEGDSDEFAMLPNCGSRGITVTDQEPKSILILSEVAALFSPYFLNIFYGGFKESNEKWVKMQDVNLDTIFYIMQYTMCAKVAQRLIRKDPTKSAVEWGYMINILEHCDRFLFRTVFLNTIEFMKLCIHKLPESACNEETVNGLQEATLIAGNNELMRSFVGNFFLLECLNEWERRFSDMLTPDFAEEIAERRLQLQTYEANRPSLRIRFDRGDIVCSLFDDFQPLLINDFIANPTATSCHFRGLPALLLDRSLLNDGDCGVGLFDLPTDPIQPPPARFYLMYFTPKKEKPFIGICSSTNRFTNGLLMGVVTGGYHLLTGNRGVYVSHYIRQSLRF